MVTSWNVPFLAERSFLYGVATRISTETSTHSFMAVANHVGHDKRGHKTYVRDSKGNEVIEETKELVKEWEDGANRAGATH